jgi:hypothetical protein
VKVALVNGDLGQRSTDAAREYVLATRARLRAEVERRGDQACEQRSFQRLQHSITAEELARTWPDADLAVVLGD